MIVQRFTPPIYSYRSQYGNIAVEKKIFILGELRNIVMCKLRSVKKETAFFSVLTQCSFFLWHHMTFTNHVHFVYTRGDGRADEKENGYFQHCLVCQAGCESYNIYIMLIPVLSQVVSAFRKLSIIFVVQPSVSWKLSKGDQVGRFTIGR